jgi:hypothetical protein
VAFTHVAEVLGDGDENDDECNDECSDDCGDEGSDDCSDDCSDEGVAVKVLGIGP